MPWLVRLLHVLGDSKMEYRSERWLRCVIKISLLKINTLGFSDFACFIFMFSLLFPARPHGVLAFGSSMSDHQSFDVFAFVFRWYPSLNSYHLSIALQLVMELSAHLPQHPRVHMSSTNCIFPKRTQGWVCRKRGGEYSQNTLHEILKELI